MICRGCGEELGEIFPRLADPLADEVGHVNAFQWPAKRVCQNFGCKGLARTRRPVEQEAEPAARRQLPPEAPVDHDLVAVACGRQDVLEGLQP